jgi:hypothetical protein
VEPFSERRKRQGYGLETRRQGSLSGYDLMKTICLDRSTGWVIEKEDGIFCFRARRGRLHRLEAEGHRRSRAVAFESKGKPLDGCTDNAAVR